jgi:hypothetical protein
MNYSKTDICNMALSRIGTKTISSIDDTTSVEAKRCSLEFDPIKESVLRDFNWNFATMIELLAEVSGVTVPGWDYVYMYPENCLSIRKIYIEDEVWLKQKPYRVIGASTASSSYILFNQEDAYIEYTANISDTTRFDASFVDALTWRLSAVLAQALRTGTDVTKLTQMYQYSLSKAQTNSAMEEINIQPKSCKYIDAR